MGRVVQFGRRPPKEQRPALPARPPRQQTDWQRTPRPSARRDTSWLPLAAGGALLVGFIALEVGPPLAGCSVKGNISPNTGERIYHVPGQEHYWATRVNWLQGERWFCSEEAAREAGWRRARR